ncbi:MAG: amidase domain-containing protein [Bacillota bacterium]
MKAYNRKRAITYAHKWAYSRNARYYDFSNLGGDCTNFISQCLYAGCQVMNYTPNVGWFYNSPNSRSASWTGVPYLYNFLISNKGAGPYGHQAPLEESRPGDIIQLSFDGHVYSHSLFIVSTADIPQPSNILIATHSFNADNRPLNSYNYLSHRLICIDGVRV